MAWLTGYLYRKAIVIAHTPDGAQTDYQLKLLVGESSGATGEDVDCGAKCLTTFNDLRFTTQSGAYIDAQHPNGECDYWIESLSGSTPNQLATVWIEVPSIAAHPDDTTIYMYYGNAGASAAGTSLAAMESTFLFADDFSVSGATWNAAGKWTGGTAYASVSNGELTLHDASTYLIYSNIAGSGDIVMRTKAKLEDVNSPAIGFRAVATVDLNTVQRWDGHGATNTGWTAYKGGVSYVYSLTAGGMGTYQIYEFSRLKDSATKCEAWINGSSVGSTTNATYVPIVNLPAQFMTQSGGYVMSEWVLIRKSTANEPTWSSIGTEEMFYLNPQSIYPHILVR